MLLAAACAVITTTCGAQVPWRLETWATGLDAPWSLTFLPDGGALVTERPGSLRRIAADGSVGEPLAGVPAVYDAGQGGLFDVVLHPQFSDNALVYLSYAEGPPAANATAIARGRLTDDGLAGVEVIYRVSPRKDTPVHYGGRMAFLPDGTLLLTTGDGFDYREAAQDIESGLGKVLRITDSGEPAPGNPFAEAPDVWSYGHRNAQGLAVAPDGTVWLHEHGPRGGDEVNRLEAGSNYGWPAVTYGIDYSGAVISPHTALPGMVQPEYYWVPSIAPSGLAVYTGRMFPEWVGDLFVGALVDREVRRLDIEDGRVVGEEALFAERRVRMRDIRVGPDGALYLVTDAVPGEVIRVTRENPD
ncbi:PQQ-dependent sugar dehydrogenase [Elongatibacter sediminis]|uniref:PQQ-dependent sugar dehydrogenase n=1 Tax=Elongatibacter sediminis TaxID=3119006 RepID=UPI003F4BFBED